MITREDIIRLGELARLKITDAESEKIRGDLDAIVGYVSELQKIDSAEVAPETVTNVLREDGDAHEPNIYTDQLLAAAPKRSGNYWSVKKIIDNGKN